MATTFDDIAAFSRAVLGDTDLDQLKYSSQVMDQHIRLMILLKNDDAIQESDSLREFTETLTATQKAWMVYSVAKSIIGPQGDKFSYKTPVLSVSRTQATARVYSMIEEALEGIGGGVLALQEDNELWAMVNHCSRFYQDVSDMPAM